VSIEIGGEMRRLVNEFWWVAFIVLALIAVPLVLLREKLHQRYCQTNGIYNWEDEGDWA